MLSRLCCFRGCVTICGRKVYVTAMRAKNLQFIQYSLAYSFTQCRVCVRECMCLSVCLYECMRVWNVHTYLAQTFGGLQHANFELRRCCCCCLAAVYIVSKLNDIIAGHTRTLPSWSTLHDTIRSPFHWLLLMQSEKRVCFYA